MTGEVARRYGLAADLLASQLEARVGSLIHGKLEGGVIYTPAYLARIRASTHREYTSRVHVALGKCFVKYASKYWVCILCLC